MGSTRRLNRHTARCPPRPAPMPQARKLESELDIKVAAYGKLCSSYEYGYSKGESGLATDQVCGSYWVGLVARPGLLVCCPWLLTKLHKQPGKWQDCKMARRQGQSASRWRVASPLLCLGHTACGCSVCGCMHVDAQCGASS